MKQYHSVVLLCVLLSLDTTLGSNHDDLSREEQDRGGVTSRRTATRKATKKTTATPTSTPTSTPTPTLQMFLEQYPEVTDRSAEEQAHLYMVYKLHLNGATSNDLEKYQTVTLNFFGCCKDEHKLLDQRIGKGIKDELEEFKTDSAALNQNVDAWLDQRIGTAQTSWGCQITTEPADQMGIGEEFCSPLPTGIPVPNRLNIAGMAQCEGVGWGTASACCRSSPWSRVGTKAWPWSDCV